MLDKLFELLQWAFESLIPFTILFPYERGLLLRFGLLKRELGPGFHWIIPCGFDKVLNDNVVARTERLSGLATTTVDGKSVGFDAVVTYRISNLQKALLEVDDLKDAIADSCAGAIGTFLAGATWEAIHKGNAVEALTAECRKRGWKWGVEIIQVQLAGIATVRNLRISGIGHGDSRQLNLHL